MVMVLDYDWCYCFCFLLFFLGLELHLFLATSGVRVNAKCERTLRDTYCYIHVSN